MKIQCDVCNKNDASVFCTADEAALCDTCDHRVHHANKLASKHQRFSLLLPSAKQFPICDVCQEKRALLFCQQDRAILCRDCDVPIHTANEHTLKHDRFLLTGVKLSATSTLYKSSVAAIGAGDSVPDDAITHNNKSIKKPVSVAPVKSNPSSNSKISTTTIDATTSTVANNGSGVSTSSISEYLEMLPGWHVEDFLDSSSSSDPFGFCCKINDGMLQFLDPELDCNNLNSFSSESMGIWVPQAPPTPIIQTSLYSSGIGGPICFKDTKEVITSSNNMTDNNKRYTDDIFTVPQISPQSSSAGFKKSRPNFWYE